MDDLELKVWLEGIPIGGLYGKGTVVYSQKSEEPHVKEGQYYTIEGVIETTEDLRIKRLAVTLKEVRGVYFKDTFIVDEECRRRMGK